MRSKKSETLKRGMFADLTGMKFGRLTVLEQIENKKDRASLWRCKCDCGKESIVRGYALRAGITKSCGCLQRESVPYADLTGKRFGKLLVIEEAPRPEGVSVRHFWKCRCDCGNYTVKSSYELSRKKEMMSCGCYWKKKQSERMRAEKTTHSMTGTRLYGVWASMKSRCMNKNCKEYPLYGGRGIGICEEWKNNFESFYEWAKEAGYADDAPRGECTLDRIDVDGDYCPENCRWATQKEQCQNKRNSKKLEYNGETHTLSEWADIVGIPYKTLKDRSTYKWTVEEMLFRPVRRW